MKNKLIKQLLIAIPIGAIVGLIIGKVSVILFPNLNIFLFIPIVWMGVIVYVTNRKKQTKNQDEDDSSS
jgi:Na+/H+-dicarboxylate symporter